MTKKQLCAMCTEYSTESKCQNEAKCPLLGVLRENNKLKAELKAVKKELEEIQTAKRWNDYPDMMGR